MLSSDIPQVAFPGQANYAAGSKPGCVDLGAMRENGYLAAKPELLTQIIDNAVEHLSREDLFTILNLYREAPLHVVSSSVSAAPNGVNGTHERVSETSPEHAREEVLQALVDKLGEICDFGKDTGNVNVHTPLAELGIDSMFAFEPATWLKSTFGADIGASKLTGQETLSTLCSMVVQPTSPEDVQEDVLQVLVNKLREICDFSKDTSTIDVHAPLAELGIDSMLALELATWLKSTFGANIRASELMGQETLFMLGSMVVQRKTPPEHTREDVLQALVGKLGQICDLGKGAGHVNVHAPLAELGLDSMFAFELANWLKSRFGADVAALDLMGQETLSTMSSMVVERS